MPEDEASSDRGPGLPQEAAESMEQCQDPKQQDLLFVRCQTSAKGKTVKGMEFFLTFAGLLERIRHIYPQMLFNADPDRTGTINFHISKC